MTPNPFKRAQAQKLKGLADIVFCVDSTGSMEPCLDALRTKLSQFVTALNSEAKLDFRLRLISYRDKHDLTSPGPPWHLGQFTEDVSIFQQELAGIKADGGGDHRGAESTLDALYLAIHSDWRKNVHRAIILLTDDNSHSTIHRSTYGRPDNDVSRIIADLQTLRSSIVYMVAPDYPIYKQIQQSMEDASRKIIWRRLPLDEKRYVGLEGIDWDQMFQMLGSTISQESVALAKEAQ